MMPLLFLLGLATAAARAQMTPQPVVYIDQKDAYSIALVAEIEKKHTPVVVTTDPAQAQYTVELIEGKCKISAGQAATLTALTGMTPSSTSECVMMNVVDNGTKAVVYSNSIEKIGKRTKPVATFLARKLKNYLSKK